MILHVIFPISILIYSLALMAIGYSQLGIIVGIFAVFMLIGYVILNKKYPIQQKRRLRLHSYKSRLQINTNGSGK